MARRQGLDRITRADVEALIAAKRAEGLTVKSVGNYVGFLHSILDYGVGQGWCKRTRSSTSEKPRAEHGDADVRFLTTDELEARLRAVPEDRLGAVERVLYLAAATTGMRQGELIALCWQDVDWTAKRIRVRRKYVRGEFGTPKSKRSSRAVPMIDRLAGELDKLSKASSYTADESLVFGHPHSGNPLDRSKLLGRLRAAVTRASVGQFKGVTKPDGKVERRPLTRFHHLRHTFGTQMAAQGVPMRALQELTGFKTTLIYADYAPSAQEADWAEAAFRPVNNRPARLSDMAQCAGLAAHGA